MLRKTTLANGIRVVSERMSDIHSASVGFWVENGSRHETVPLNGISHFLEHMLFKGTSSRNALDIAREADAFGGLVNAFTSREYSCYYAKVLASRLYDAIGLLTDIILNSTLDDREIEKERKVVLQEISMVEDAPEDLVHDLFSEQIWHRHPLGLPVLGRTDSVNAITRADLVQVLNQRYLGQNIVISAAGQVDHDELCRRVEKSFSRLPEGEPRSVCTLPEYRPGVHLLEKPLEQVHLCLGCKGLPQTHDDRFALQVLNTLLGASMSSRLFQRIREERGLSYSVYSYLNCHSDAGALVVYSGTAVNEAEQVLKLIIDEFNLFKEGAFSQDEVRRAREQIKGNILLSLESSDNRMSRLARNEIYHGYQPALEAIIEKIDRVDAEKVAQVACHIFAPETYTLQAVGKVAGLDIDPDLFN